MLKQHIITSLIIYAIGINSAFADKEIVNINQKNDTSIKAANDTQNKTLETKAQEAIAQDVNSEAKKAEEDVSLNKEHKKDMNADKNNLSKELKKNNLQEQTSSIDPNKQSIGLIAKIMAYFED